jgi:hypothetical protein
MALHRPHPRLALGAVALAAAVGGLAGCGSSSPPKPTQAALFAKLKSESELQSFSDSQIECVAAAVRQYGDPSSLDKYVAGRITADQLTGSSESTFQARLDACLKGSTASG